MNDEWNDIEWQIVMVRVRIGELRDFLNSKKIDKEPDLRRRITLRCYTESTIDELRGKLMDLYSQLARGDSCGK